MNDENSVLLERVKTMAGMLEKDLKSYICRGRFNYGAVWFMSIMSSVAGVSAALLGLIPSQTIAKWEVGIVAALSPALLAASRQLGFQQKANWHYRKADRIKTLQRRLAFELPTSPTADNLAAISRAWSAIDTDMSKEWEDMQQEPTAKPRRDSTTVPDSPSP